MHYLSIQNYEYVSKTLSFSEVNVIPLYFDKYCKPLQRVINTASAVQDDIEPWTIPTELTLVFSLIALGVANWLLQIVIVPYPPAISFLLRFVLCCLPFFSENAVLFLSAYQMIVLSFTIPA